MADVKWIKIVVDIFDDEKILLIESLPAADSIITIWFKLLTLAGKQNNQGVFLLNDTIPYTEEMLATIFRREVATVRLALETFQQFGMIEIIDGVITIPNWGKHQSLDQIEKKKEYQKNYMREYRGKQKTMIDSKTNCKTNGKTNGKANVRRLEEDIEEDKELDIEQEEDKEIKDICSDVSDEPIPTEPEEDVFISWTTNKNEIYNITKSYVEQMKELYPAVDVEQEFRNMKGWILSHPQKRKTKRGQEKFINSWLSKEQDKGGSYQYRLNDYSANNKEGGRQSV